MHHERKNFGIILLIIYPSNFPKIMEAAEVLHYVVEYNLTKFGCWGKVAHCEIPFPSLRLIHRFTYVQGYILEDKLNT